METSQRWGGQGCSTPTVGHWHAVGTNRASDFQRGTWQGHQHSLGMVRSLPTGARHQGTFWDCVRKQGGKATKPADEKGMLPSRQERAKERRRASPCQQLAMIAPASLPCPVIHPLPPFSVDKGTGAGPRAGHWSQEPLYQVTVAVGAWDSSWVVAFTPSTSPATRSFQSGWM